MLLLLTLLLLTFLFFENNKKQTSWLPKWDRPELRVAGEQVPKSLRKTFQRLLCAVAVPESTLHHLMLTKEGMFRVNMIIIETSPHRREQGGVLCSCHS
jgi:hypothetical protein